MGVGIGEPQYRGKGYGTEATQLLLKYAFHEINLHRVQLTVFAYNLSAIAVYEKLGFVKEGVMRERLHRDGQRHDVLLYSLLRHEWEARQNGQP
jgi:RimJ/RimL family protein N-acetyltransferase